MSDDGREVILAILGESDFFGEMSLLDGEGRSANIVANENAEVLTLSRSDFLNCLETYPKIAISLLEELAIRLRKSDQHIESLIFKRFRASHSYYFNSLCTRTWHN